MLYGYALEKEITMSTIDTRILGSTVAELVGVRKEHQGLVFEIVSALHSRNPKNEEMIAELCAALYPHLETVNAVRQSFQALFRAGKLQYMGHFNYVIDGSKRGDKIELPAMKFESLKRTSVEELNNRDVAFSFNASQILAFVKHRLASTDPGMAPILFITIAADERYYTRITERAAGDLILDTWKSSEKSETFEKILFAFQP